MLRAAFPEVVIITGAVDDGLREAWLEGLDTETHSIRGGRAGNAGGSGSRFAGDEDWIDGQGGRRVFAIEPGMGQIGKLLQISILSTMVLMPLPYRRSVLSVRR